MSARSRKAVFPAAGLGTASFRRPRRSRKRCSCSSTSRSFSTASRRPSQSGVDNIVIVTGRGKNAIEDHFDVAVELESFLEQRGKTRSSRKIRKITQLINVSYVRQGEPLGLGHAVLVTQKLSAKKPFAVILGDDVIDADPPALQADDRRVTSASDGPVLAVERVPPRTSRATASCDRRIAESRAGVHRIVDLVEKPRREGAVEPGDHRPLHPDARHLSARSSNAERSHGEIQLTNGLRQLLTRADLRVRDRRRPPRHGNKLGF
jgi:UTP--glucose-1-phosphate uridylyltransferase